MKQIIQWVYDIFCGLNFHCLLHPWNFLTTKLFQNYGSQSLLKSYGLISLTFFTALWVEQLMHSLLFWIMADNMLLTTGCRDHPLMDTNRLLWRHSSFPKAFQHRMINEGSKWRTTSQVLCREDSTGWKDGRVRYYVTIGKSLKQWHECYGPFSTSPNSSSNRSGFKHSKASEIACRATTVRHKQVAYRCMHLYEWVYLLEHRSEVTRQGVKQPGMLLLYILKVYVHDSLSFSFPLSPHLTKD